MKVTDVKTIVVENVPPYFGGKYFLLLQVDTSDLGGLLVDPGNGSAIS